MIKTGCVSTDEGIKRWKEFYGKVDRNNLCKFLDIGKNDYWYRFREIVRANLLTMRSLKMQ
jgi:hypothetical protein